MKFDARKLFWYFSFPPAVKTIAVICVVVYIIQTISARLSPIAIDGHPLPLAPFLQYSFGLYLPVLLQGAFWQPITYSFMHGSWMHLFLNLFTLLFFGSSVERMLGTKRFWQLFLISSVIGGIGWMICDIFEPRFWGWIQTLPSETCLRLAQRWGENQIAGQVYNICIGASAGVFGLIGAFVALCPEQRLTIFLFYILPIKMQARYVAILLMFITLGEMIFSSGHVAHAAHIFGGVAGYFFCRSWIGIRRKTSGI